jgi:hypothetical protein
MAILGRTDILHEYFVPPDRFLISSPAARSFRRTGRTCSTLRYVGGFIERADLCGNRA